MSKWMKNRLLYTLLVLFASVQIIFICEAKAQSLDSCPDMNGYFTYKSFFVSATLQVAQNECNTMAVQFNADVFGTVYNETFSGPLDGVLRLMPAGSSSAASTAQDSVSMKFEGDILSIEYYQGSTDHLITAILKTPNELDVNISGHSLSFKRTN